ncbi:serine/threonine-protein kinase TOR isoform X2 [Tanacetum coccineum]|uniref:Serine/threonine-protein kinase TOR isoform X2 n=1 Tax=Tanacetum coccineum TaxID=301880 RepID=A0ABQ5F479_9ASTR
MLAYLKYQWSLWEDQKRKEAFARLHNLAIPTGLVGVSNVSLMAHVYLKLGTWQWALSPGLGDESIQEILSSFRHATHCATKWANAWHTWALFNTAVMSHYTLRGLPNFASQFVVAAVTGYFHSIACAAHPKSVDDSLQFKDILRLLTLWFNHGATSEVQTSLQRGFSPVNINTWLVVLPHIISRIHSNNHAALMYSVLSDFILCQVMSFQLHIVSWKGWIDANRMTLPHNLFAIWTPGETPDSFQPPKGKCRSQESGVLCNDETCFFGNSAREANLKTVRRTLLYSTQFWNRVKQKISLKCTEVECNDNVNNMAIEYNGNSVNNIINSIIRKLGLAASVYLLWQERNNRLFIGEKRSIDELYEIFVETIRLRLSSLKAKLTNAITKAQRN